MLRDERPSAFCQLFDSGCHRIVFASAYMPSCSSGSLGRRIGDRDRVCYHAEHREVVVRIAEDHGFIGRDAKRPAEDLDAFSLVPAMRHSVEIACEGKVEIESQPCPIELVDELLRLWAVKLLEHVRLRYRTLWNASCLLRCLGVGRKGLCQPLAGAQRQRRAFLSEKKQAGTGMVGTELFCQRLERLVAEELMMDAGAVEPDLEPVGRDSSLAAGSIS